MKPRAAALAVVVLALLVVTAAHQAPPAAQGSSPSLLSLHTLRVGMARGSSFDVTSLPLEQYVARVIAGEAARDSHPAALEALAIAVRTYALANLGRHRSDGFDLCDQTHCQVVRTATPPAERAAQATAGQVLLDRGVPASIYYSASCGGRTEVPSAVWPGAEDLPFLPSRPDDGCRGEPVWTAEIATADLAQALAAAGFRGTLRAVRVASQNGSGRVARLRLDGLTPPDISGQDLRVAVGRTLGWQHIRSTAFELRRVGRAYRFAGHGSGHGVGMCVLGSGRLAVEGQSASAILARYFPGLLIGTSGGRAAFAPRSVDSPTPLASTPPAAEVFVLLPEGDEGEAAIASLAARARDDIARALDVPVPARLSLRFHPTISAYERATGERWFKSAAVLQGELHLLPPAVLRDRGVLERTVRHALVHLLTDSALTDRPQWVREGAAVYFAEGGRSREQTRPAPRGFQTRLSCPDDAELEHPVSMGALSMAYARARACFARQIESGRSWREVR